jgi:predicted acetyltransferase
MRIPLQKQFRHIEIIPAEPAQQPILANLLELYIHDFSEFHKLEIGADGRFGYNHLALYWSETDRYPFLIRVDGKLAGLVLVKSGADVSSSEPVWDMAEFFVLRGYRKHGIGTHVAQEVWRRFPGRWQVRVMEANVAAHHFWAHAISTFTGGAVNPVRVKKDGAWWQIFSFVSRSTV